MREEISRWKARDQEGLRRFTAALEQEYQRRVDEWIQAAPEHLPKFQGAALVYRELLEFFKHVLTHS